MEIKFQIFLARFRLDRPPDINRYAAVCFEVDRLPNKSINPAEADKGSEGKKSAMSLLGEIKDYLGNDEIAFGTTFRGSGPFASCASDKEFLKVKLLLAELEPKGVRWELQVFHTVVGQSNKQLGEWTKFIECINRLLIERLKAERIEWSGS
jgi:hypothetical protein